MPNEYDLSSSERVLDAEMYRTFPERFIAEEGHARQALVTALDKLAERHPVSDRFWRNRVRAKDDHYINIGRDWVVQFWLDHKGAFRVFPLWPHKSDTAQHPSDGYEVPGLEFDPTSGRMEGPDLPLKAGQRFPDRMPGPEHVLRFLYELGETTADDWPKRKTAQR